MVKYRVILASKSPRRRDLLGEMGHEFDIRTLEGIDESYPDGLTAQETALHIAEKKRAAFLPTLGADELLITADTIVCLDDVVLGKPEDDEEACEMLRRLSGRSHDVVTGVTVTTGDGKFQKAFAVTTRVVFAELSEDTIRHYVERYKPLDKAGAYGIQEWIGTVGILEIDGSYNNVVGLPTAQLKAVIEEACA